MKKFHFIWMLPFLMISAVSYSAETEIVTTIQQEQPQNSSNTQPQENEKEILPAPIKGNNDSANVKPSDEQKEKANDKKSRVLDLQETKEPFDYKNTEKGYEVVLPKGWDIKEGFMGLDIFAISPLKDNTDGFRENINIVTEDLSPKLSLDEYFKLAFGHLKSLLTDFKEIKRETIKINGNDALVIVYQHRMGQVRAEVMQVFLNPNGDRVYIITSTASPNDFNEFQPVFNQVIESFKLLK